MKWTVLNVLGALIWLSGLSIAKGMTFPDSVLTAVGDNRFEVGMGLGLVGIAFLLWTNLRSTV